MAEKQQTGMEEVIKRVQATLRLSMRNEAEALIRAIESCLEDTLIAHLAEGGYSIKLGGFGRFVVRHRQPIRRKVGFSGEIRDIPPVERCGSLDSEDFGNWSGFIDETQIQSRLRAASQRLVPTSKAIEESVDLAYEIFIRVLREIPK